MNRIDFLWYNPGKEQFPAEKDTAAENWGNLHVSISISAGHAFKVRAFPTH